MLKPNKPAVSPLVANGVTKRFHQGSSTVEALRNVSLEFQEAESVAVMGASGSGKSTLRHAMGGLTSTDSGEVLVEGQLLAGLSGAKLTDFRRRRIGFIFQQFNLIPGLTAVEHVLLPQLAENGRDRKQTRELATSLLERLELRHRMDHRPDAMSSGEQQRVAIARDGRRSRDRAGQRAFSIRSTARLFAPC